MDATLALFQQLQGHIDSEAFDSVLQVCDAILAASPGDVNATRSKFVALLELSRYKEALQVLEAAPTLAHDTLLERAYCLYHLNQEEDALKLLGDANEYGSREAQLAAQIKYRQGGYSMAASLFSQAEVEAGSSPEASTNILAALVSANRSEEALALADKMEVLNPPQYERLYNQACAAIGAGWLVRAKELVQQALHVCRDTLSGEDFTEEEMEVELGVLTAQAAYIDQRRGATESAQKAYATLFSFKSELDPIVAAVAANNLVSLRGERDLFDSWKKCRSTLSESLSKKLTTSQREAFLVNAALLSVHMSKSEQCRELLATLEKEFPLSEAPALIRAASLNRSKQFHQCEEMLEVAVEKGIAEQRPMARTLLTLAQLHCQNKEPQKALSTLQRIEGLKGEPGMVAVLAALHERVGDVDGAAEVFKSRTNMEDGAAADEITRASSSFFARHGRWPEAAAAYRRLLDANPRNLEALAGLVVATSHFDVSAANEVYGRLELISPSMEGEGEELDAEQLEQAALPNTRSRQSEGVRIKRVGEEDSGGGRRKKRRRRTKIIYPKGFDPEKPGPPPDPERWLPKRERSTYRQRKRDKRAGISRGPQGSATGAARVDARATTNMKTMTEEERAKLRAEEEVKARAEAAAAAAVAASGGRKKKGKAKAGW